MSLESANNINFKEEFEITTSYPDITLDELPQDVLMLIKRAYAGKNSEFTSVTQYIYNHFILWNNGNTENISHTLEEIAVKEMEHYETLAKVLIKCGVDPKSCVYIDGNPNICDYWKANFISYEKEIKEMFKANIILEQTAINGYVEIVQKTTDQNLKEIINRIILDEESHIKYFKAVLNQL